MLLTLNIKDFVIVDQISLDFEQGFTVLTGETGAGKSIILDALGLLLGSRAEGQQVRAGCDKAELSALFDTQNQPELQSWLQNNEFETDEGELIIRRVMDKNGKSRNFINGQAVTLSQLKELGPFLVDIHGQHAHQSLVKTDTQRKLLDAFAGATDLSKEVEAAYQSWQQARAQRIQAESVKNNIEVEKERLSWQINELQELSPNTEEWAELNQQHLRLANAVELLQVTHEAIDALSEADQSCLSILNHLQHKMSRLASLDPRLADILSLLDSVDAELREVVYGLRSYANDVDEDPSELSRVETRMDALLTVARKFRTEPQSLSQKLADWQQQYQDLEAQTDIDALIIQESTRLAHYRNLAEGLSQKRRQAAQTLSLRITEEMQTMAMDGAKFAIELSALAEPSAHGLDSIEYLVAANVGSTLRPLAKVASGGELSRISLAMQVVISQVAAVPTLIFDEVDVGIGGRVAEVIGRLLKQLGQYYQVLCVTHLPQVASCGDQHWQVSKSTIEQQTISQIHVLSEKERIEEIARMLGGEDISSITRQHATEMLQNNT